MNRHRTPAPVYRAHALTPTLGDSGIRDTPENRAQMERVLNAAEAFEVINGRVVQVRDPATGRPLVGRGF